METISYEEICKFLQYLIDNPGSIDYIYVDDKYGFEVRTIDDYCVNIYEDTIRFNFNNGCVIFTAMFSDDEKNKLSNLIFKLQFELKNYSICKFKDKYNII